MKSKLITLLALLFLSVSVFAQEKKDDQEMQTLFDLKKYKIGYYGSISVGVSEFNNKDIVLVGGQTGIVINHNLAMGFGGKGIVNMPKFYDIDTSYNTGVLEGGYGGFILEPKILSKKVIHLSFPIMIGAGGLFYMTDRRYTHINDNGDEVMRRRVIDKNAFFVIEPGVEIELNLLKFMRVSLGANYRWTPGIELQTTPENAFNGLSAELKLKFGKF